MTLPLPPGLDFLAPSRHPFAALRSTRPQTIPPNAWTALEWAEALADNGGGWTRKHPTSYEIAAGFGGFYDSRLYPLSLPDLDPGVVSTGILIDGEPAYGTVLHRVFRGQDPEDRRRGVPPQIVEIPAALMFHAEGGRRCEVAVRHTFPGALGINPPVEGLCWTIQYLTARDTGSMPESTPCPCSQRTLEAAGGTVVWRAADKHEWCGNPAQPWTTAGGETHDDGWCEDCIYKRCEWCRHD